MNGRNLLRAAFALPIIAWSAGAAAGEYQIPWKDIRANQCAILVEPDADGGRSIVLRCKGHIGVALTVCTQARCIP